jgi:hypothetical protein
VTGSWMRRYSTHDLNPRPDLILIGASRQTASAVLQIHDNNVYMYTGQDGSHHHPVKGHGGGYHEEGPLWADHKATIKLLVAKLSLMSFDPWEELESCSCCAAG